MIKPQDKSLHNEPRTGIVNLTTVALKMLHSKSLQMGQIVSPSSTEEDT
jgi:hypothetical protein